MAYSKANYNYNLEIFYRKINKKKYKLQILEHNIHYTKVITMQDNILIVKTNT